MSNMLIALAGRKCSGKTSLAVEIIKRGFVKISFADRLKEVVAQLYDWELSDLYSTNGKEEILEVAVWWDSEKCKVLSELIGKNIGFCTKKKFLSRREALQFIGTDIIRSVDADFYVDSFKFKVLKNKEINYVVDDLRFPNEFEAIKELGGIAVHVMRPYYFEYSNHLSEIALNRHYFEYIFINDGSEHKLLRKFNMFLDGLLSKRKKPIERNYLIRCFKECEGNTSVIAKKLGCSRDKVVWWATKFMINISRNTYDCDDDSFRQFNAQSAYWAGIMSSDGTIKAHLKYDFLLEFSNLELELVLGFKKFIKSNKDVYTYKQKSNGKLKHSITISSKYMMEDFKLWNLEPLKSKYNKIPDCLKDKPELFNYWLVGLIDGDGSVSVSKRGTLAISILASKEIVDYVLKIFKINGKVYSEKGIDNLFKLQYNGKCAVAFYNKVYRGVGLARKWDLVMPFMDKKWHH